ncbi:MAG: endonuclease, partial [Erysipelotrichaceae bacterium]|nr:endonuclease [Erysipelotrichaceae bacterium]
MRNNKLSPMNKLLALSFLSFATIFSVTNTNLAKSKSAIETHAAQDLTTLYSSCESAVASKSLSNLWSSVKTAANSGYKGGSYSSLWTWYWTTDVKDDGSLMDYYSNTTNWTSTSGQCGSNNGVEGGCYNREHSIPKSWWGGSESNQGCDIYIVVPTDAWVNSMRSNYAFGVVGTISEKSNNGYSKLGTSARSDYSGTVFEPNDQWKGDFARIYFYARAKWNTVSMTKGNGSSVFSGNDNTNYGLTNYAKKLFYEWHKADPVDAWELQRNSRAESVQGNRNPFIDHPEYADYLWGGVEIGTGGTTTTAPENLTITGSSTISVGGTSQLSVSTTTSGASTSVTWSTSNSAVATVSTTGVVTGVKAGTATITATSTVDTSISATLLVTVKGLSSLSTSGTPTKTSYTTADNFDSTGLTVTANYSDGSTANVTNDVAWSKPSTNGTVTGTYGGLSVTVSGLTVTQAIATTGTATYTITAKDAVSSSGAPSGSSATYSQNYTTAGQLTSGKSATLTLSGYDNCVITGITLSMKSNKSSGSGSFTAKAGTTTIASIVDSMFSDANWNGAWSTSYVDITPTMSNASYSIQSGENVTLTITASAKSLYIESYTIAYTQNTSSGGGDVSEPDSVTLNPTSLTMYVGESITLTATANGTVTWSTSKSAVATVSTSGVVTDLKAGTATITATVGTASATCS